MMSSTHSSDVSNDNPIKEKTPAVYIKRLPLLTDKWTQSYVKFSKVLLVLQDPDRKSRRHWCKELKSTFKLACDLLTDDGCTCSREFCNKNCSVWSNATADLQLNNVLKACQTGINLVVVNKCMLNAEDINYFVYVAYQTKYVLLFEPPILPSHKVLEDSKNVSSSQIQVIHSSFGWYLNDSDSDALREEAAMYLIDCMTYIDDFRKVFHKCSEASAIVSYYHLDTEPKLQEILYCASKICGYSPQEAYNFLNDTSAGRLYGKIDTLNIVGFVITPNVVAARINLSYKQREIWGMCDEFPLSLPGYSHKKRNLRSRRNSGISVDATTNKTSRSTLRSITDMPYNRQRLVKGKGRTAHFVLGVPDSSNCDYPRWEVAEAIMRERNAFSNELGDVNWYDIGKAFAKRFGKYWIVDLKHVLAVDAMFASACFSPNNQR